MVFHFKRLITPIAALERQEDLERMNLFVPFPL